ncbi:MAG TPA: transposase zinc-binding domain-containing protein, partial [Polyangiaceae bacterium]|nr:transposase zinc-binding domain-containing protein [Polyangiaceae bacterium]
MGSPAVRAVPRYEQRHPESTVLYRLVAEHLESFLAVAQESTGRGLPRYVERELYAYLACGIHAHGFLRARCAECGKELLVAFSCKRRGVCPSCNARRMCATAAHLTDRVLPDVPLRQWVLSVPFELRLLLAKRADALSAVGRIFVQEVLRWQRAQAR